MKIPDLPLTASNIAEIVFNTSFNKIPNVDLSKSFDANEYFEYIVQAVNLYPEFVNLLKNINNDERTDIRPYLGKIDELLKKTKT